MVECVVAFVLAVAGVVVWQVNLQDVRVTHLLNRRPFEAALATPNLARFHHRGRGACTAVPATTTA
jgi:hypothetical protein